jgi:hypothetical protein
MNLKARIALAMHPDMRLRARIDSLDFAVQGEATLAVATGEIRATFSEVPLRLTIPFHRRRRVIAGSLGPFNVIVRPAEATIRVADARLAGEVGGEEGIAGELHCEGSCRADVEIVGEAPGKLVKAAIETAFEG